MEYWYLFLKFELKEGVISQLVILIIKELIFFLNTYFRSMNNRASSPNALLLLNIIINLVSQLAEFFVNEL